MGIADLTGCWAKLGRAEEHARVFYEELRVFTRQDAKTGFVTCREEEGWHIVRLNPIPALPQRLALIVGDCLNNIRAALDHLAWQLVLREDQEPGNRLYFPICKARKDFAEKIKEDPLLRAIMNGDAGALIERAQPFNSPQPKEHALSLLAQFTNVDKHRLLLMQLPFVNPEATREWVVWRPDLQPVEWRYSPVALSAKEPTEVARLRFTPGTNPGVDVKGNLRVEPSIGDGKTQMGVSMVGIVLQYVREILKQVAALPWVQS